MARRGHEVRALRERLGLSQKELAELVGVHAMTVSKWERGVLAPADHARGLLKRFAHAAERGIHVGARGQRRDPLRTLAALLGGHEPEAHIDLGTLSATNRYPGRVVELARGDVMSKVVVEIAPGLRMGAVITTDSVDRLGLTVGARASAIVKATEVIVAGG